MLKGIQRELHYLKTHPWDLCLVTLVPFLLIVLLASMFYSGKAEHLAIAVVDQDNSTLSHTIIKYLDANQSLNIAYQNDNIHEVETLIKQNKVWGYIHIPQGAEQRLVHAQDAQISIAYNQSFYSIGNSISSALQLSALRGIADFTGEDYFKNLLPDVEVAFPHVKISTLYNPDLNYEFYLEAFMVPAILHLLLCCCVAFSVGQEFKLNHVSAWLSDQSIAQAIFSKLFTYIMIFCAWSGLWLIWMIEIRGWFVAGSLSLILIGQFLLYSAYALISTCMVLITKDLNKTFGLIAVYGGSSLSFSGVTLPLNNAPLFTQMWANIIPYTPYAKLQTQQWVIGSPITSSFPSVLLLIGYVFIYASLTYLLFKKRITQGEI